MTRSLSHSVSIAALSLRAAATALAAHDHTPAQTAFDSANAIYSSVCIRCHSPDGSANPVLGTPSFVDPYWQGSHKDAELEQAIRNGLNNKMPGFGATLSADDIHNLVVTMVRSYAPAAHSAPQQVAKLNSFLIEEPNPAPIEPSVPAPGHGLEPVNLGRVGVYTQHNNNSRTGDNLEETILTPANVNDRRFGLLFRQVLDDQPFTQPLYVPNLAIAGGRHDVVFVATVANTVYAFDADREGPPLWKVNLGPPASIRQYHFWCVDILGNMGIIGTPVIDPSTRTLAVVALTHEGANVFVQRLHALDITTGAERPDSPIVISAPGFNPIMENQRPAILLSRGGFYVAYSSHCDTPPYHGYIFRFNARTLKQESVINLAPDGTGGTIFQSGQGPAADEDGNIYVGTSNGIWDGQRNFSDSFIKTDPQLHLLDWFTPSNWREIEKQDGDINTTGPMLVPGTSRVIGIGKLGILYVLDRNNLGHLGDEHAAQHFQATNRRIYNGGVYWKSARRGAMVCFWGEDDHLLAFALDHQQFNPVAVATGQDLGGNRGGMLSLSAHGDRDGILWANVTLVVNGKSPENGPAVLRAFDADDITHELWSSDLHPERDRLGRFSKNAPPTVANGKVYVSSFGTMPSGTGALYVYGLVPE